MFARQSRHHVLALAFALFATAGMLSAVDTRAMHAPAEAMMAAAPAAVQTPTQS